MKIRATSKHPVNILGDFEATFSGTSPSKTMVNNIDIAYVSDSVDGLFLSNDTMVDLLIINEKFPTIVSCSKTESDDRMFVKSVEADCPQATGGYPICSCPKCSKVPLRPNCLLFKADEENNERMKVWLLEWYASSTFNV